MTHYRAPLNDRIREPGMGTINPDRTENYAYFRLSFMSPARRFLFLVAVKSPPANFAF